MTAYEVTAGNRYFYQRLVVLASDIDAAHDLFKAFLVSPSEQAAEDDEYEMGVAAYDKEMGGDPPDRSCYAYDFCDADVKEYYPDRRWVGTPTETVQRMSSGRNG